MRNLAETLCIATLLAAAGCASGPPVLYDESGRSVVLVNATERAFLSPPFRSTLKELMFATDEACGPEGVREHPLTPPNQKLFIATGGVLMHCLAPPPEFTGSGGYAHKLAKPSEQPAAFYRVDLTNEPFDHPVDVPPLEVQSLLADVPGILWPKPRKDQPGPSEEWSAAATTISEALRSARPDQALRLWDKRSGGLYHLFAWRGHLFVTQMFAHEARRGEVQTLHLARVVRRVRARVEESKPATVECENDLHCAGELVCVERVCTAEIQP